MDEQILKEEEELQQLQGLNDSFSPLPRVALPAMPAQPDEEQVDSELGDTQNPAEARQFKSAPVEERLLQSALAYKRNKHSLRQQQLDLEARAAQPTGIDRQSQLIVQRLSRDGPVEERLIRGGQLVDMEKQESLFREEQDARKNARPNITPLAAQLERPEAVSERLIQFQRLYQDNLTHLKEQLDQQLSFRPQINQREARAEPTGRKSPLPEPPSFQPKLSKRSLQIAARLGKPRERLLASKSKEVLPEDPPSFRPVINKRSELLDYRSHGSRGQRWETLYETKREPREQPPQEEKLDDECTFRPKILNTGAPSQPQQVVQRLLDWSHAKDFKVQQAKESCGDKDLTECTFMPTVLSKQLYELKSTEAPASMKGVDKFLERQRLARRRKEEVEERLHIRSKSNNLAKAPSPEQEDMDFMEAVRLLHIQVQQL